jgi:molybdate transport system substrate-binding protein
MVVRSCFKPVFLQLLLAVSIALASGILQAEEVRVAVAANFAAPMKAIAAQFENDTSHTVAVSTGATAKFYAQIQNGAPFDVFLSADSDTPARLEKEGLAVPATRFTYAVGRLALWSARPGFVDAQGDVLKSGNFSKLALASPKLAPYGAAAQETLTHLGLLAALQPRFVVGESIAQAYSFVATGNAPLGFVALSQIYQQGNLTSGSVWVVPQRLHTAIRQDAIVLTHGKDKPGAAAFMGFLKAEKTRALIRSYGYETGA